MVSYDAKRDKFIVLGGRVIRASTAESLRNSLDSKLKMRKSYLNSELSDMDMAVNTRAIKLLCLDESGSEKIPVTIGFALKDNACVDLIPEEYIIGWINKYDTHGKILLKESNVKSVFEETDAEFSGFQVEFADSDVRGDFRDEIKQMD